MNSIHASRPAVFFLTLVTVGFTMAGAIAADETWSLTGVETVKMKGYGLKLKDTVTTSDTLVLHDDGSFETDNIQDGSWSRDGNKFEADITPADVERILESFSEDLGTQVAVDSIEGFKIKSKEKNGQLMITMAIKAYVSLPEEGLTHVKVQVKGKYIANQL